MRIEIQGLNLERLLREAQQSGLSLRSVRRVTGRSVTAEISPHERPALLELCARFGWEIREISAGPAVRALRFLKRRPMLALGAVLCAALLALSSELVLVVSVSGAQEYEAEVERFLQDEGAKPGSLKRALSLDSLRERLLLRLPGISYAGMRYAGSVLVVDCHLAREGEKTDKAGESLDLVASQAGIVTKLVAGSGTPQVRVGDAVYAGQVLVRGEERAEQGGVIPVRAQAQVLARVWAAGEARAALFQETAQETGERRTRVTLITPFFSRVLKDAQPFDMQEEEIKTRMAIDLFVPLYIKTETFSEIRVVRRARSRADAASLAQGAAENLAKKQLPAGALILDKWVDYSMIDNEFLYASVVLEYEKDIAVRADGTAAPAPGTQ